MLVGSDVGVGSGVLVGDASGEGDGEGSGAVVGSAVGVGDGVGAGSVEADVGAGLTTTVDSVGSSACAEYCPSIRRNSVRISAANMRSGFILSP